MKRRPALFFFSSLATLAAVCGEKEPLGEGRK